MINNRYQKSKAGYQSGFTLVELMVTIAIMAVVASIALPSFSSTMGEQRIKNTTSIITNALKEAKAESYLRHNDVNVVYNAAVGGATPTIDLTVPDPVTVGATITIATYMINDSSIITIVPANAATLTFLDNGRQASAAVVYTICDNRITNELPRQVSIDVNTNITTQQEGSCV